MKKIYTSNFVQRDLYRGAIDAFSVNYSEKKRLLSSIFTVETDAETIKKLDELIEQEQAFMQTW